MDYSYEDLENILDSYKDLENILDSNYYKYSMIADIQVELYVLF